jgi:DNA-binding LytR/AlgR family response regulator
VLMIEDDYYHAARALRGADAEVMGTCPTAEAARDELEERRLDAVALDGNLGLGAACKLAETLKDRGISFVFVTGYDQQVIPPEFEHVEPLEKPVELRRIVAAVSKLVAKAT